MMHAVRHLIAIAALGAAGCSALSSRVDPVWVESSVRAPTEQVLWDAALLALQKQDYPLGAVLDRSTGQLVSGWKMSLAAFRGQGWRTKAWIEFDRESAGQYLVQVRVQKETNEDIIRPLDPSHAKWEEAEDDDRAARILLQTIRSYLGPDLPEGEEGEGDGADPAAR
jgi:hypothetical protein